MVKKLKNIGDLSFDSRNINKGTEKGGELLKKSLQEVGAGRSVLADMNGVLIAGNKTIEQAAAAGINKIRVVQTTGDEIVVVQRTDIDINSADGAKMKILDNTVSKHNYLEDAEVSEAICEEVQIDGVEYGLMPAKIDVEEDNFVPNILITPITEPGDIYELNGHRFTCGSSTDPEVVKKTLAGAKPILMVTDPTYGVKYDPTWRHTAGINNSSRQGKVQNDDIVDWTSAYMLFPGSITYVWHGGRHARQVAENLETCGFDIVCQIIWNKQQMVFSRGDYHWKHEPCWYAVKKGQKHNYLGDRKQTTVWDIKSILQASKDGTEANKAQTHGTQKPLECMARPIRNNTSEGDSVYDPFLGSGTSLIAAEQLNRTCYGQEIDPIYCDMIVGRFIKYKRSASNVQHQTFSIKRNGQILSEAEIKKYLL